MDGDVGQRSGEHEGVAVPAVHPTDRARGRRPAIGAVVEERRLRPREEVDHALADRHRAGTGSPAAVRGRKGLVEIHVDDVKAHVAGANDAQDRIEVGAVVVEQSADLMDRRSDLRDVLLEEARRVGIGEHDPGDLGVERLSQGSEIDQTAIVGRDGGHLVAAERRRCRVRSVRRVRDQDPSSSVAVGLVVRRHEQQPGQLTGSTSGRLEGCGRHASDLAERTFKAHHDLEPSLDETCRCSRMDIGEPWQGCDRVTQLGVVLHGARAQRIGPEVDRELPVTQTGEVGHQVPL